MRSSVQNSFGMAALIILLAFSVGCSSQQAFPPSAGISGDYDQSSGFSRSGSGRPEGEVAPGFLISITSATDKQLTGEYRIGFDGQLNLPYRIHIQTEGLTEDELISKVTSAYSRYFKTTSGLRVEVVERSYWVDARGLVRNGGRYLVSRTSSLDEVISKAGGLDTTGSTTPRYATIRQPSGSSFIVKLSEYYSGAQEKLPIWEGGDLVFIQSERVSGGTSIRGVEKNFVQVLGEVGAPGEYRIKPGADFYHYLVRAQGPANRANLAEIEVIRTVNGKRSSITFSASDADQVPIIQGGDIIIIPPQDGVRFLTDFATVINVITSIALLALV